MAASTASGLPLLSTETQGRLRRFCCENRGPLLWLYGSYSLIMLVVGMTLQAPYIFLSQELHLGIAWVGSMQPTIMIGTFLGGILWQCLIAHGATVANGLAVGPLLAALSFGAMACAPNVYIFVGCAALAEIGLQVLYYEAWMTLYSIHLVECREETSVAMTALRYIGGAAGVALTSLISHIGGTVRFAYGFVAILCLPICFLCCGTVRRLHGISHGEELKVEDATEELSPAGDKHLDRNLKTNLAHMLLFSLCVDLLRVAFPMTLNLQVLQANQTAMSAATAGLSLCNGEAAALMLVAPALMRLQPAPRWAAAISFCLLGLGHLILAKLQGYSGVITSCVLVGLGEASSCGLRGVVVNFHRDKFTNELGRHRARQLTQFYQNLTLFGLVCINAGVPLLGAAFSMTHVITGMGVIGCFASVYGACVMPTIPRN